VRFSPDDFDPTESWLTQPGAGVADGTQVTVAGALRDSEQNPLDSGSVVFHVPTGLTATFGGATHIGPADVEVPIEDGAVEIKVSTLTANTYTITADVVGDPTDEPITIVKSVNGTVLRDNGRVLVTFGSDAPDGPTSELTITTKDETKYVGGQDKHTAQVDVKDANGNAVGSAQVIFQWTTGDANGPVGGSAATFPNVISEVADAGGVATAEIAAPNNEATWIWVRAFVVPGGVGSELPVGAAEVTPAYPQALKGARFAPTGPDPDNFTFETYTAPVLNNLLDESWALVVVRDTYGNGIGGRPVTFTLPATQPGADGTPVFVGAAAPGKTITVDTCDYDLDPVPDECKINGVYTPGLAYVPIVSDFEGTFTVTGTVDGGALGPIDAGSGPVTFDAGSGSAQASWFTVEKTDIDSPIVRADDVSSYTLTVTVMNGEEGASLKPVSGECVALQLPQGVRVKSPAPATGTCPSGTYVSDNDGEVTAELVSTRSGFMSIGARLGGSDIPTVAGGSEYTRSVLFVGGLPSNVQSELTSPMDPVRADDPVGQKVVATVLDVYGNLASCWAGALEVPCVVEFWVPEGTSVGLVEGPAWVAEPTTINDYGALVVSVNAGKAIVTFRGVEGSYAITARVNGVAVFRADGVATTNGLPAEAHIEFLDATAPGRPVVDPSDGGHVTGRVDDADLEDALNDQLEVVVRNDDGVEIARCPVAADGTFDCPIVPRQPDGTDLIVVIEDSSENSTDPPVEIVTDGASPAVPHVDESQGDVITGRVDDDDLGDAGEGGLIVVVTDPATGDQLCTAEVQPDGAFSCEFYPPLEDGDVVVIKIKDPAGNLSEGGSISIDSTPPAAPMPEPSTGETITGIGDEVGDTITVKDETGEVLCTAVVQPDRTWQCDLEPAAKEGDMLTIIEEDPAHNTIAKPWRVGVPEIAIAKARVCYADVQSATGVNFQPGETITAVTSGEALVGRTKADADGQVAFTWRIPEDMARNVHTLTLRGPQSGAFTVDFTVYCSPAPPDIVPPTPPPVQPGALPYTGADGVVGLVGAGLGLLLAGLLLLLAAKRRRREEDAATS
jgi:LPXTG-motif cell wall-anchored protein